VQFDQLIVEAYGNDIVGWPKDILFANPSKICQIGDLSILYATLSERTCHWVQLTPEEQQAQEADDQ